MNKRNLIVLILAVVLIVVGGVYFLGNLNGENQEAQQSDETGFRNNSGVGEPSVVQVPDPKKTTVEIGSLAPDFTLYDMDGKAMSLSEYKGKKVFLNFWATWCGFCDLEMPDLQKINDENDDLVVLAVNVREEEDIVKSYIEEGGYDFPVVFDEDGDVASMYLISGMPTTYFINEDGVVTESYKSMLTLEQMEDKLKQMRDLEE